MKEKNTKKVSINLGIIIISFVLILILIADVMIIITNKRNDEKLDKMTQNIITRNNELVGENATKEEIVEEESYDEENTENNIDENKIEDTEEDVEKE